HSDYANYRLPALGPEISRGNKQLKAHAALSDHARQFMLRSSEKESAPTARGLCTRGSAAQIFFPIRVPQSRPSAEMSKACLPPVEQSSLPDRCRSSILQG